MNNFLKNIIKNVKQLDNQVSDYKKNTKDLVIPSYAYNNWAIELLRNKDEEEALKKLEISVNTGHKNPETFIYLGVYKLKHKEVYEAIEYFLKAIRIDRNNAKAYAFLGSAYCDAMDYEQSKRMFQKAIKLDKRNVHTHLNYAIALAKMGDVKEASNEFEKASIYSSSNYDVLFVWGTFLSEFGYYKEAIEKLNLVHSADPFHKDALYFLAYCNHKSGEHELAAKYAKKLLVQDKTKAETYIILAECYLFLNNKEKCLSTYEEALKECENAKKSFLFFHSWATSLQSFGEWKLAIDKLNQASEISPDNFLAPYNLSISYLSLGDKENAEIALKKTIELNPEHSVSLYNLGQLYVSNENYKDAIFYFERANKTPSQHNQFNFNIAYCYQMLEDNEQAIKYYEKHLEYYPKNIEALTNLANIYSDIGDNKQALRKIRTAYIEDKTNTNTIIAYAVLLLKENQIFDAMEKFDEALKINSNITFALYGKCECLVKSNKPREALEVIKKAEEEYGNTKDFLMSKLLAVIKLYEIENREEDKNTAFNICDKIKSTFGEDEWINKTKEKLGEK